LAYVEDPKSGHNLFKIAPSVVVANFDNKNQGQTSSNSEWFLVESKTDMYMYTAKQNFFSVLDFQ